MMVDIKERSRESLRLQIGRGSEEEVWAAFEELMRRNMEEEQESTSLVEITLKNSERWRKLHREDPDATIDIYEEFDGAVEELNFLRDQLEEVRSICLQIHRTNREKALKILDKEFRRSDSSLISRHMAIKALVIELLAWAGDGVSWMLSESPSDLEVEEQDRAKYAELTKKIRELLGIEEEEVEA